MAVAMVAATCAVLSAYAVRVSWLGRPVNPRLDAERGTLLLGRYPIEAFHWTPAWATAYRRPRSRPMRSPTSRWSCRSRRSLSYRALAFALGGAVLALGSAFDALDGIVARTGAESASDAGRDARRDGRSLRRCGLASWVSHSSIARGVAASRSCLSALVGSMMVSYVRAKADALGLSLPQGLMRRPERIAYFRALLFGPPYRRGWRQPIHAPAGHALIVVALIAFCSNVAALRLLGRRADAAPSRARSGAGVKRMSSAAEFERRRRHLRVMTYFPGPSHRSRSRASSRRGPWRLAHRPSPRTPAWSSNRGFGQRSASTPMAIRFPISVSGDSRASIGYGHPRYEPRAQPSSSSRCTRARSPRRARQGALESLIAVLPRRSRSGSALFRGAEAVESAIRLARALHRQVRDPSRSGAVSRQNFRRTRANGERFQAGARAPSRRGPISSLCRLPPLPVQASSTLRAAFFASTSFATSSKARPRAASPPSSSSPCKGLQAISFPRRDGSPPSPMSLERTARFSLRTR